MISPSLVTPLQPPFNLPSASYPLPLWGCSPTHSITYSNLTSPASPYSGASNLHRTKGLPFHWLQTRPSSATYVPGAMDPSLYTPWLVVKSLGALGGPANWRSLYGVSIPCSSRSSARFPTRVPELSLMVGFKHPHLHWSVAGQTSQRVATPGSCQQAPLGNDNSVGFGVCRQDVSPGGAALPSVSAPYFGPIFPLDKNISGLKTLRWVCCPILPLGAVPIYWRWSLQVLSPLLC